jgi:hypothetical protein
MALLFAAVLAGPAARLDKLRRFIDGLILPRRVEKF